MPLFTVFLVACFILGSWAPDSFILRLGNEDQPVEYLGALCWAIAALICAVRLLHGQEPRLLLATWLLLTVLFLGEEISWGQRIIGFETPSALMVLNTQDEVTIHNLEGLGGGPLNAQNLFRLGFVFYFLVVPLLTLTSRARGWLRRVGYHRPDTVFLSLVWFVVVSSIALQMFGPEEAGRVTAETQETFYAFVVLTYVYLYLRSNALPQARQGDDATRHLPDSPARITSGHP
jgi:hypothetical protein